MSTPVEVVIVVSHTPERGYAADRATSDSAVTL
jgi:hypothetical protein